MGKELARMGAPFRQPEWSALALMEDPSTVVEAHRRFVEAGADVITVNSYAVVPFHIGEEGFAARGRELAELAGRLARQVADEAGRRVRVAGSLPPLFGSYEPDLFDPVRAPELLRVLIEAQAPAVDLWLVETVGSCAEAEAIGAALDRAGASGERWFAFGIDDAETEDGPVPVGGAEPTLWSGETVAEAARAAVGAGADAVLLNCATPEAISAALPGVVAALESVEPTPTVGAYANGFPARPKIYSANGVILDRRDELTPSAYAELGRSWIELGARIVGGCCAIHPEHIAELARRVGPVPAVTGESGQVALD